MLCWVQRDGNFNDNVLTRYLRSCLQLKICLGKVFKPLHCIIMQQKYFSRLRFCTNDLYDEGDSQILYNRMDSHHFIASHLHADIRA